MSGQCAYQAERSVSPRGEAAQQTDRGVGRVLGNRWCGHAEGDRKIVGVNDEFDDPR